MDTISALPAALSFQVDGESKSLSIDKIKPEFIQRLYFDRSYGESAQDIVGKGSRDLTQKISALNLHFSTQQNVFSCALGKLHFDLQECKHQQESMNDALYILAEKLQEMFLQEALSKEKKKKEKSEPPFGMYL